MERSLASPPNKQSRSPVRYDGKTVIITGAGAGLGRAYALMYAKLRANVVVNDISEKHAKAVADEVVQGLQVSPRAQAFVLMLCIPAGGKAVTAVCSAEDGETIVKAALDAFGSVHVLVANAGILRDKSFASMTTQDWDQVMAVHLR